MNCAYLIKCLLTTDVVSCHSVLCDTYHDASCLQVRSCLLSTQPVPAARLPCRVKVSAGKHYAWCACGHSKKQVSIYCMVELRLQTHLRQNASHSPFTAVNLLFTLTAVWKLPIEQFTCGDLNFCLWMTVKTYTDWELKSFFRLFGMFHTVIKVPFFKVRKNKINGLICWREPD